MSYKRIIKKSFDMLESRADRHFQDFQFARASKIYSLLGKNYHCGYCYLLCGNKDLAKKVLNKTPQSSARDWGLVLIDFIDGKITRVPSYLQIRAFYEKDIHLLLKAKQLDFVRKITSYVDFLAKIHLEVYKYTGRAFLNSEFASEAYNYLSKSLFYFDTDPETYYLLGRYHLFMGEKYDARANLIRALELNENHFPAKKLFEENFG